MQGIELDENFHRARRDYITKHRAEIAANAKPSTSSYVSDALYTDPHYLKSDSENSLVDHSRFEYNRTLGSCYSDQSMNRGMGTGGGNPA